jgi:hypothetical protein
MIELDISWDGTTPGLAEHRLSIALFATPLRGLLTAARRTANNMLREAMSRKESDTGRLNAEADRIDIQIVSLNTGSTNPSCVVTVTPAPDPQALLWPEGLAEEAIDRLLLDIEHEGRGIPRNTRVREYFRQLPPGITNQDYILRVDGVVKREVHLGVVSIAPDLSDSPYLVELTGNVVALGFDPGRHFVRVKTSDSSASEVTLTATKEQVDRALETLGSAIRILAVCNVGGKKLLRLQRSSERRVRLDQNTYIFEKWRTLLARLAQ